MRGFTRGTLPGTLSPPACVDEEKCDAMPKKSGTENSYGYDPESNTVRVGQHDLARLLLMFRSLARKQEPGSCEHMRDYDLSFERLADAVDAAAQARQGPAGRTLTSGCAVPLPKPSTTGQRAHPTTAGRRSRGTCGATAPTPPPTMTRTGSHRAVRLHLEGGGRPARERPAGLPRVPAGGPARYRTPPRPGD